MSLDHELRHAPPGRHRAPKSRRRRFVVAAVLALVASTAPLADATTTPTGPAFTATKTVTRINYDNGADSSVDTRTVTVTVSKTTGLEERQGIEVTWSGAHPTGGLANDPNSLAGAYEEYPVVVMECRGVDSATAPANKQVSPETCYTQSADERYGYSTNLFPAFRMDRYATAADRDFSVDPPKSLGQCSGQTVDHYVPFVAVSGAKYYGGFQGCAGIAPEQSEGSGGGLQPASTTYGVADRNGDGSTNFIVQTDVSNASLGCSSKVVCTLEVIPIEGISCDPAGDAPAPGGMPVNERPAARFVPNVATSCEDTGTAAQGSFNGSGQPDYSPVTGQYWWSPSNWRNRIAVPLSFAPSFNVCGTATNQPNVLVYGSEPLLQATQQWAPALCLNSKLFSLRHVQSSEPEAKNLLALGNIEAAYQSEPPATPFATPTVQAPTAVTGFAIAAIVDGADGHPYPQIRLDARLLAKLMSESYEACALDCLNFPALASNPSDITRDPEFQALNPGVPPALAEFASASTMTFISADSDVMQALTSYINEDPEARSWLDGRPDPWGMVVNPAYEGMALPVSRWPLLDTHVATAFGLNNLCVSGTGASAWLPLVASPLESSSLIAQDMQFGISPSQVSCANSGLPTQKLTAVGRLNQGSQFLLGVVSLADAIKYQVPTAALETQRTTNFTSVFTNATGRSFITPTSASLLAAAKMMTPDDTTGSWTVPYEAMRTTDSGLKAYPGVMLISTDVPTTGLPKKDATEYGELLKFQIGPAQTPGKGNGQIPPGYVPITAKNGLGAMVNYAKAAAADVAAQQCVVPFPSGKAAPAPSCNLPKPPTSGQSSGTVAPPSGPTPSVSTSSAPSKSSTAPTSSSPAPVVVAGRTGKTLSLTSGALGLALPLMALIALGGLAIAALSARRRRH